MFSQILPSKEMQLLDSSGSSFFAEESSDNDHFDHFSMEVERYSLIIERGDIRSSDAVAVVCPENQKAERGGFLAAAIKCAFKKSFNPRKLSKLAKDAIATTEHINESGNTQFILHVQTTVWERNCDEKELKNSLKHTIDTILKTQEEEHSKHGNTFNGNIKKSIATTANKPGKRQKQNIPSVSPTRIKNVEDDYVVRKCCEWQIEKIVEVLKRTIDIPNLQEVRLINKCRKTTTMLITEMTLTLH